VCVGTRLCRGCDTAMALMVCRRTGPRWRQAAAGLRGSWHGSCRNKGMGAPTACYTGGSSAAFCARRQQYTRRVHGARDGSLPVERENDRGGAVKRHSCGESTSCRVGLLRDEGAPAATSSSRTALGAAAASLGGGITGRRRLLLLGLTTMAAAWSSTSSSLGSAAQPTPPSSSLLLLLFPPLLLLLHDSPATHGSLPLPLCSRKRRRLWEKRAASLGFIGEAWLGFRGHERRSTGPAQGGHPGRVAASQWLRGSDARTVVKSEKRRRGGRG
jgi:hypothetical protein